MYKGVIVLLHALGLSVCLFFLGTIFSSPILDLPRDISCLSYNPTTSNGKLLSPENTVDEVSIRKDLEVISLHTKCIRTYTVLFGAEHIPSVASEFGMEVLLGAWIDEDKKRNEMEVEAVKGIIAKDKNILKIVVGNEVLFNETVSVKELISYIKEIKKVTKIPVGTGEIHLVWGSEPELAKTVDYIGVHIFPYWDGLNISHGVAEVVASLGEVQKLYPKKKVYLLETGWPSGGTNRGGSIVGIGEQRLFFKNITSALNEQKLFYNLIEAFDQPWKIYESEGRTGAHWGLYRADRSDKFDKKNVGIKTFGLWVGAISFFMSTGFFLFRRRLTLRAHIVAQYLFLILVTSTAWTIYALSHDYLLSQWIVLFLLLPSQIILYTIAVGHMLMVLKVYGKEPELDLPLLQGGGLTNKKYTPFVSIHIPCSGEDPLQVIEAVSSCLAQEYPHFEVVLVDNNTEDVSLWKPLKEFSFGKKNLKFIHREKVQGYKAGALNLALEHTAKEAEVIAVVDSDYIVSPLWLKETVPFLTEKVKVVQCPQSYRKVSGSIFEELVRFEQKVFFEVGMKVRATSNSIIQHGTMCLIERKVLEEVGSWATWCITEDTELGVRILSKGYTLQYVPTIYGSGIAPQNFFEFSKQRFRWSYGAMRMLLSHWRLFFGFRVSGSTSSISFRQKVSYLSGWLYWYAHLLYPFFLCSAFFTSYLMLREERLFPPVSLSFTFIAFFCIEAILGLIVLRMFEKLSFKKALLVLCAGVSLTTTISFASFVGLFFRKKPFLITSKIVGNGSKIIFSLWNIRLTIILLLAFFFQIFFIIKRYGLLNFDVVVWIIGLCILSLPQVGVVVMTLAETSKEEVLD